MIVDSHCHLDHFQGQEQDDVVARARAAGVATMVTIGTRLGEQAATVRAIADRHQGVFATVGIHPHNAGEREAPTVEEILFTKGVLALDAVGGTFGGTPVSETLLGFNLLGDALRAWLDPRMES